MRKQSHKTRPKRSHFIHHIILVVTMSCMPVMAIASTIFSPTDGTLNLLFGDLKGGTLFMFDDSDLNYQGDSIQLPIPSTVDISGPINANNDYLVNNTLGDTPLTLTETDNFTLALNINGTWLSDSSIVDLGADSYTINFSNGASLLMIDAQVVSAVPLPAAIWLFTGGLLGLVGLTHRRNRNT